MPDAHRKLAGAAGDWLPAAVGEGLLMHHNNNNNDFTDSKNEESNFETNVLRTEPMC